MLPVDKKHYKFKHSLDCSGVITHVNEKGRAHVIYTSAFGYDDQQHGDYSKRSFAWNQLEIMKFDTLQHYVHKGIAVSFT